MHNIQTKHRDHSGPTYKGISIHASPGLHEIACAQAQKLFKTGEPILELAAGSGALSLRLTDVGFSVIPVDLDAGDWALDLPLHLTDFNKAGWQDQLFQGQKFKQIIALEVIEHLENPSQFFRDISSLLERDGYLLLSTPNVICSVSIHAAFKRGAFAFFSPEECFSPGHIAILPWWLLNHMAARAGLEIVQCTSVCTLPLTWMKRCVFQCVARFRKIFYRPSDFTETEGLNVIAVFKKK